MLYYRTSLFGHRIEMRRGDLGGHEFLLNGRLVKRRLLGWLTGTSHHLDLEDRDGESYHVEVRLVDESRFSLGKYRMVVMVDGIERARVKGTKDALPPDTCAGCGYSLVGLPIEDGSRACPECGELSAADRIDATGKMGRVPRSD